MPNIQNVVLIGAPVEKVYNAITTQKGLSSWWTPNVEAVAELNSVALFHFGNQYFKEMKITELVPFDTVKWNCIKATDQWIGTNISFKLIYGNKKTLLNSYPDIVGQIEQLYGDNGTLLLFGHTEWKDYTVMFGECSYTWGQFLKSLKLFCETGEGCPWPNQHRLK